jgi:hypothetical protein
MATACGAAAAWLGAHRWFVVAGRGRSRSMAGAEMVAAACSGWGYPETIGKACLAALPAVETSKGSLTRMLLGDVQAAGGDCSSARTLARAIRELSRDDFRCGRIVTVGGWMLSLTETRAYALAAGLPQPREAVE